jgi:hypothetical protein
MMDWQIELSHAVAKGFERAKLESPGISLRAYAKSVNTPASTVSEILSGKFSLAPKRASEIVDRLNLSLAEKNRLHALLNDRVEMERFAVSESNHFLLSDWAYFAVLHFVDLELNAEERRVEAISARLGLEVDRVRRVVEDLVTSEMLARDSEGNLRSLQKNWQFGDGPPSGLIREYHRQNLRCAEAALERIPAHARDFSTTVFAGNSEQIETIRSEVRKFHEKICALAEGVSPKDRVYSFSVSFFPLDLPLEESGQGEKTRGDSSAPGPQKPIS